MGTPGFAVPCLEALNNSNHKVLQFIHSQQAKQIGAKLVKSKIEILQQIFLKYQNPFKFR